MNSGLKRKRGGDGYSSEDPDDCVGLSRQVLPVADLPNDFNDEPMDGLQYLFVVRRDSRNLPHTTRALNPYEIADEPGPIASGSNTGDHDDQLPSPEWREIFVSRFANFRKNLSQPTIHIEQPVSNPHSKTMPDKKERDLWWLFLEGRPRSEWDPPKAPKGKKVMQNNQFGRSMRGFADDQELDYYEDRERVSSETWKFNDEGEVEKELLGDPSESLPTPHGTPGPSSQKEVVAPPTIPQGREPLPSIIQKLDHKYSLHLLMYFSHWINHYLERTDTLPLAITDAHARWIFSLLAKLDDFVSADDMNLLRNLARACISYLKRLLLSRPRTSDDPAVGAHVSSEEHQPTVMKEHSCWIIITTVADYWAQRDLWEDVSSMFADVQRSEPSAGAPVAAIKTEP